ncbi:MAG: tetratricopeptide repeat protein [Candidatus Melainabacteria bacterium]|nr:tetratricopeptide repeat protein [Candidatus Melainabacteria bacterium]
MRPETLNSTKSIVALTSSLVMSLTVTMTPVAMAKEKQPANSDWRTPYVEGERKLKTQELEAAEAAFSEALRKVKSSKKGSADDVALCYQSLASVHYMRDRFYEQVLPLYKRAISTLENAYGKESPKLVPPLVALAGVREDEGDNKSASKLLTRAVAIVEKADGKSSLTYADYLHRLGRVNFRLGFPRKAEDMYLASLLVVMQQKVLPSSEILEQHLADYIDLLSKAEDRGKSLTSAFQKELLKDSVASFDRAQGVAASTFNKEVSVRLANPETNTFEETRIFGDLANTSANADVSPDQSGTSSAIVTGRRMTDFAAMEQINKQRVDFYERMISTDILSLGPEHPSVARDLSGLASLYLSQRKFAEAKPLLQKALAIYEKSYTPESSMIKKTQALLELVEDEQNLQSPGNTSVIADYVSSLPSVPLAAQKLEVALRLNYLAFLCYCQGKLGNAEKIYAWAVASTAKAAGEQSLLAASSLFDFSRVLRSTGRQTDAETMDNTARAILRRSISQSAAKSLP